MFVVYVHVLLISHFDIFVVSSTLHLLLFNSLLVPGLLDFLYFMNFSFDDFTILN